ncbi:MAG: hypothetical protein PHQ62_01530 [Clostridia bacterium]|nr:hypothetical protein [Clostridia bacterium]
MNSTFSNLFKKLKSIKHIEIILAVLFALIILLVYFSGFSNTSNTTDDTKSTSTTISAYTLEVEQKLSKILSKINGVGNVDVMIMVEQSTNFNTDVLPSIVSVVVVAQGASNVWVKLDIIKAVETLLKINTANIEVLAGDSG